MSSSSSISDEDNPIANFKECHICNQVGVPVFHSIRCDPTNKPHWESSAGSSLVSLKSSRSYSDSPCFGTDSIARTCWWGPILCRVLDPRSKNIKRWNRGVLLARGLALAVDPLFFNVMYMSTVQNGPPCFYMHFVLAIVLTVVRTCVDLVHLCHVWLQFRLAYVSSESMVVGCGKLVWDARAIASHNRRSFKGIWLDSFVILPVPQVVIWFVVPKLLKENGINLIMTILLVTYFVQFFAKLYHSIYLLKKLQKVTGYIFGSVWWRFNLNLLAYLIAAHALPVLSSNSLAVKILYPIFWGLLCLSSFGNVLAPTSNVLEVIFSICITLGGLALFTTLVANIQVFLHTLMATKKNVLLKHRDMVRWMKRRQLPLHLRRRVHRFERQRWAAMEGQDEMQLIKDLPDGLRRDIKRYLCIDLVKKVPPFQMLDDLILDNICDLVTPHIYGKGEKIIREGDPVQRMVFVVHGRVRRSQALNRGFIGTSMLQPGSFFGDELLAWCLRRPFIDRLPSSSATFVCVESIEAYCLDADQLRYITDHFRYQFAGDRLMRTMRYYSSNWRSWAAVTIQIAWRRNRTRTKGTVSRLMHNIGTESLLRHYAVYFMSLKPQDHLE
nr:cyclic nucleotide-gated ion channel 2 [Quercus suber]